MLLARCSLSTTLVQDRARSGFAMASKTHVDWKKGKVRSKGRRNRRNREVEAIDKKKKHIKTNKITDCNCVSSKG